MNIWYSFGGVIEARIVCADPAFALTKLAQSGIVVSGSQFIDPLTVKVRILRVYEKRLIKLCADRGYDMTITERKGAFYCLTGLLRRPVLLFGIMIMLISGLYFPSRILFVRVEGNNSIPQRKIMESAARCGVHFGASRVDVRSEKMKNALLEAIPELQWAGVNTNGCVAVISVRERQEPEKTEGGYRVSSIVATRDGMITDITVTKGSPKFTVGQSVKKGDVLISGYTDCGLTVRATRAEGEIYAKTQRELAVLTPAQGETRAVERKQERIFSILIGKNRINLYFGSGISDAGCVRMYEESYIILPGGFQLPVGLATDTRCCWDTVPSAVDQETAEMILSGAARSYLSQEMVAGSVQQAEQQILPDEGVWLLEGSYDCREMIGTERSEEIQIPNGNTN